MIILVDVPDFNARHMLFIDEAEIKLLNNYMEDKKPSKVVYLYCLYSNRNLTYPAGTVYSWIYNKEPAVTILQ